MTNAMIALGNGVQQGLRRQKSSLCGGLVQPIKTMVHTKTRHALPLSKFQNVCSIKCGSSRMSFAPAPWKPYLTIERSYYSAVASRNVRLHTGLVRGYPSIAKSGGQWMGIESCSGVTACRALSSQSNFGGGGSRPPPRNRLTASLAAAGTGAAVLFGKGKYLIGALKLTKFASLGSMLVTVGTYSMFFGVPYAVGAVGLIAVHESGHALVMHKLGIPFSPMVFIPFMGAAVAMKEPAKNAYEEALVAFGGPYLGTAGAVGLNAASVATGSDLMCALADFGYMINLFNLLPIGMMDGGRICGAVSPYAGVAGLGMGGFMIYEGMIHNPIFYLIFLAGGWETFQRLYDPTGIKSGKPPNYYNITAAQRSGITAGYFGLLMFLFGAMAQNRRHLKPPEVLQRQQDTGEFVVRFEDGKFE